MQVHSNYGLRMLGLTSSLFCVPPASFDLILRHPLFHSPLFIVIARVDQTPLFYDYTLFIRSIGHV
jgi:hypothetical protein